MSSHDGIEHDLIHFHQSLKSQSVPRLKSPVLRRPLKTVRYLRLGILHSFPLELMQFSALSITQPLTLIYSP